MTVYSKNSGSYINFIYRKTEINLKWRLERIDQMTLSLAEQQRIFVTLHVVASRIFFDNIRTFTSRMTKTNEAFSMDTEYSGNVCVIG